MNRFARRIALTLMLMALTIPATAVMAPADGGSGLLAGGGPRCCV